MLGWWYFVKHNPWYNKRCRMIVGLLLNTYRIGYKKCALCLNGQQNDITHVLFQCESLLHIRTELWAKVIEDAPGQLGRELEAMSIYSRSKILLNALNCDFIEEWSKVYKSIMFFVCTLFQEYDNFT